MDADALALLSWQFFFPLKVSACFASSIIPLSFFWVGWGHFSALFQQTAPLPLGHRYGFKEDNLLQQKGMKTAT